MKNPENFFLIWVGGVWGIKFILTDWWSWNLPSARLREDNTERGSHVPAVRLMCRSCWFEMKREGWGVASACVTAGDVFLEKTAQLSHWGCSLMATNELQQAVSHAARTSNAIIHTVGLIDTHAQTQIFNKKVTDKTFTLD